jgi:hypothetical protein
VEIAQWFDTPQALMTLLRPILADRDNWNQGFGFPFDQP